MNIPDIQFFREAFVLCSLFNLDAEALFFSFSAFPDCGLFGVNFIDPMINDDKYTDIRREHIAYGNKKSMALYVIHLRAFFTLFRGYFTRDFCKE